MVQLRRCARVARFVLTWTGHCKGSFVRLNYCTKSNNKYLAINLGLLRAKSLGQLHNKHLMNMQAQTCTLIEATGEHTYIECCGILKIQGFESHSQIL